MTFYKEIIDKYPVLSAAEESQLLVNYRTTKSKIAKDKLVYSNMRYVVSFASNARYQNRGLDRDELVEECIHGLIKAIDKYDVGTETRLLTYANYWMHQAIMNAIYSTGDMIHVPQAKVNSVGHFNVTSLDAPIGTSDNSAEESTLESLLASPDATPEESFEENQLAEDIQETLANILTREEVIVVTKYIGFNADKGKSLAEIGKDMGKPREHIRKIYVRALDKLQSEDVINYYESYMQA